MGHLRAGDGLHLDPGEGQLMNDGQKVFLMSQQGVSGVTHRITLHILEGRALDLLQAVLHTNGPMLE